MIRGSARVVSTSYPPQGAVWARLRMTLVVEADGIPPTSVEFRSRAVRTKCFPAIGQTIPVRVDPDDPTRIKVLWKEVPSRIDQARSQADDLAARLRGTPPAEDVSSSRAAPDDVAGIVDQIERLARLRDSGALSEDEFRAAKSRLLDPDTPPGT